MLEDDEREYLNKKAEELKGKALAHMSSDQKQLYVVLVRSNKVCTCDTLSGCFNSVRTSSVIRSWGELIQLLEEHPHMVVGDMRVGKRTE